MQPRARASPGSRPPTCRCPATLVCADEITRGKPDPEPYLLGAERLGVAPADCVVLEDAPAGIAAGKAAGMTVIALRTTHADAELAGRRRR